MDALADGRDEPMDASLAALKDAYSRSCGAEGRVGSRDGQADGTDGSAVGVRSPVVEAGNCQLPVFADVMADDVRAMAYDYPLACRDAHCCYRVWNFRCLAVNFHCRGESHFGGFRGPDVNESFPSCGFRSLRGVPDDFERQAWELQQNLQSAKQQELGRVVS